MLTDNSENQNQVGGLKVFGYNKGERSEMALPLNIDDLIHQRKVESARIEYKKDWNPEKVLHSVCAFANDIDNWGGHHPKQTSQTARKKLW